jgi:uncharacterized membrane-anchored protein YhcB (DUF1043 family)
VKLQWLMRRKGAAMSKVFIGVFSGIFIGAVIYELLNRSNPEFIKKVEDLASRKIDELCDIQPNPSRF